MSTDRQTFSIRLSSDEKATVVANASTYGMSVSEYSRYCLLNAPPPTATYKTPTYDQLVSSVSNLAQSVAMLNTNASPDAVAQALDQARAVLGPREE